MANKKIGEVCIVGAGNSAPQNKDFFIDGKYPFFRTSDVGQIHIGNIYESADYLNEIGIKGMKLFKKGTILIPKSGASTFLNHRVIMGVDGYVSSHLATIKTDESILDNNFLFYFLLEIKVQDLIQDHKYPSLNLPIIENIEISYPPLPEQKKIVKTLDETFKKLEKAKDITEKNLQNSKELFESSLRGVFNSIASKSVNLGEVSQVIGGYSFKSTDFKKEGKYQVIRMGNVRPGIIRINESPVFLDVLEDKVLKRALLLPNDVIITQTGTKNKRDYGFTVIIDKENYLLNQRISAIRFSKNYLPKFFLYFSWTNIFKDQYFKNETGTVGQGNVGIGAITSAKVPDLSLREQQAIVKKLDQLSDRTKKLESIYQSKLLAIEELKKSILSKAFSKGL